MNTLDYLLRKFDLKINKNNPLIEIPNVGRDNLPHWLKELNFKTAVEVGVAEGEYSETLARANPQMTIFGVDPWQIYEGYDDYTTPGLLENMYRKAKKRLTPYPSYKIIRKTSLRAMNDFQDNSLDFVYIDANHKDPFISDDIRNWHKKLRPGGIISGHDYIRIKNQGTDAGWTVVKAVRQYVKKHNINPWFLLGLNAKIKGVKRDKHRSFMWVKP